MNAWIAGDGTFHEIYSGGVFVHGEYLGEISYDSGRVEFNWQRNSLAYFCPKCGEIWARVALADSRGVPQSFRCIQVGCETHGDPWNVGGSLLADHVEKLLEELPPRVVFREFNIHLKELA